MVVRLSRTACYGRLESPHDQPTRWPPPICDASCQGLAIAGRGTGRPRRALLLARSLVKSGRVSPALPRRSVAGEGRRAFFREGALALKVVRGLEAGLHHRLDPGQVPPSVRPAGLADRRL